MPTEVQFIQHLLQSEYPIVCRQILEANQSRVTPQLIETMKRFADTEGLIIDLRGNGGGTRAAGFLSANHNAL